MRLWELHAFLGLLFQAPTDICPFWIWYLVAKLAGSLIFIYFLFMLYCFNLFDWLALTSDMLLIYSMCFLKVNFDGAISSMARCGFAS